MIAGIKTFNLFLLRKKYVILNAKALHITQCNTSVLNEQAHGDVGVAEYILEHSDKEVNFVDSNYKYEGYYSRMQVLIKDKKLKVIPNQDMSQIDKGTYFITYMSSELGKKYENEGKLVKKGAVFGVYQN